MSLLGKWFVDYSLISVISFPRWMYLDDQNLCAQTSSSFVYGAVPIGASIYVVGDLDTGKSSTFEIKITPCEGD